MINKSKTFQRFENELIKKEKVDIAKNFQLIDAMYDEARALGVIPPKDLLNGFEIKLKLARVINHVSKTSQENSK